MARVPPTGQFRFRVGKEWAPRAGPSALAVGEGGQQDLELWFWGPPRNQLLRGCAARGGPGGEFSLLFACLSDDTPPPAR